MFKTARIKLTLVYSALFLIFIWMSSFAIFWYCNNFFHQQYVQEIQEKTKNEAKECESPTYSEHMTEMAVVLALDKIKVILLVINGIFLVLIPGSAWILTGKSLKPIEEAHIREKQFVANAAHDLRTPLTILSTEMEVALQKNRTETEYKKILKSNKEEVEKLSKLVDELLFLARFDTGKKQNNVSSVDLTDVVSMAVALHAKAAKKKNLKLIFNPPEENVGVNGNKTMLIQLFSNLIDNAVKYTEKGKITVLMKHSEQKAIVEITDTGIGIERENLKKIFDRFYRIDTSRSETKGYGLGLSIVDTILKIHKGTITVESTPKKGTKFVVSLPIG